MMAKIREELHAVAHNNRYAGQLKN